MAYAFDSWRTHFADEYEQTRFAALEQERVRVEEWLDASIDPARDRTAAEDDMIKKVKELDTEFDVLSHEGLSWREDSDCQRELLDLWLKANGLQPDDFYRVERYASLG